jgi:RNA polymerase sigma-70 factor (ECF subfamily)
MPLPRASRSSPALDPDAAVAHLPRLYGLARRLSGSADLAEELTQETYLRVLARPRRLRNADDYPYLARTLRNVVNDHWRAERRRTRLVHDPPPAPRDPEEFALTSQVHGAVAELPEGLRQVVVAVDVAGMTYAQAADRLRIPAGTVMSRLHRGRRRLAAALGA